MLRNTFYPTVLMTVALLVFALLVVPHAFAVTVQVHNENVSLSFNISNNGGISLISLYDNVTQHEYLSRPTYLFEFALEGGTAYHSDTGLAVDSFFPSLDGSSLTINAHATGIAISFIITLNASPGDPAAVVHMTVTNTSDGSGTVRLRTVFPKLRGLVTPGDPKQAWGAVPQEIGSSGPLYVPSAGSIAALMRNASQEDVFYVRGDGSIWTVFKLNNGVWSAPIPLTGVVTRPRGSLAAVVRNVNQVDVFYVGNDGAIWTVFEVNDGAFSQPIQLTSSGLAPPGANLAALMRNSLQEDVFVVGNDGNIWSTFQVNGSAWQTAIALVSSGASIPGGGLAAVARNATQEDLFYTGTDGSVRNVFEVNDGAWSSPIVLTAAGVTPAGATLAAIKRNSNQEDLFYLGSDGALWTLFELNNGLWSQPLRVTSANVAPPGGSLAVALRLDPVTAIYPNNQEDVFYTGNDGVLWTTWELNDSVFQTPVALTEGRFLPAGAAVAAIRHNNSQEDAFACALDGAIWTTSEVNNSAWLGAIALTPQLILGMPFDIKVGLPRSLNTMEIASLYDPAGGGGVFFADVDGNLDQGLAPIQFNLSALEVAGFWVADLAPGGSLNAPGLAIGVNHSGDWHTAVDFYVKRHQAQLNFPNVPAWLREAGAIYSFSGGGAGAIYLNLPASDLKTRITHFNNLPQLLTEAQGVGTNIVYIWDYWQGMNDQDPGPYFFKGEYIPRNDMGGPQAFTDGIAAIHARGGRVIVYLEAFIISKNSAIGLRSGPAWQSSDPSHQLENQYACNPNVDPPSYCYYKMAAPYTPWQDYIAGVAANLVREYGVDGIFLDSGGWQNNWQAQVAAGPSYTSLQYSRGVLQLADKVRTAVQAVNPDAVVLGETTSGELSRHWDGGLSADFAWERDTNQGRLLESPARYGLPQVNYFSNGLNLNELNQVFATGYSLALCCNYQSSAGADSFIYKNNAYIKYLVDSRRIFKNALIYGRLLYQPPSGNLDVRASLYQGFSDEVLTVVNTSATEAYSGVLTFNAAESGSKWIDTLTGETFTAQGLTLSIAIPPSGMRLLMRQGHNNIYLPMVFK